MYQCVPHEIFLQMAMIPSQNERWLFTRDLKSKKWTKFSLFVDDLLYIDTYVIILVKYCQFYMDSFSYIKAYIDYKWDLESLGKVLIIQSNLVSTTPSILRHIFAKPNFVIQNSLYYTTMTLDNATIRISVLSL